MLVYNLVAEYVSLLIISILIVNFLWNDEYRSETYKIFRYMCYFAGFSIVTTIATTLTTQYREHFPLALVEGLKVLYFILTPNASAFVLLYALSLTQFNRKWMQGSKKYFLVAIPYAIYTVVILANYAFNNVFTITMEDGYVRGSMYQITYLIAAIYVVITLAVSLSALKSSKREMMIALCLNILVSSGISSMQLLFSEVLLAGISSVSGILVIYLFLHNVNTSTDRLTGLRNRSSLTYKIINLVEAKQEFSMYVFSLRNFKDINERLGLSLGDILLGEVANNMRSKFDHKSLFRYSGDEFAILQSKDEGDVSGKIEAIADRFLEPFNALDFHVKIDVVYARVDFPEFGTNVKSLVTAMDYSISRLKEQVGTQNCFFDVSITNEMHRRNNIIDRIKQAIENDGFEVYYQAIFSAKNSRFSQAEALIRMKYNDNDPIYPNEFIPIAEKMGLIIDITYIVVEKVCKELRRLIDLYGDELSLKSVSVNFPYLQFLEPDMLERITKILNFYHIPPSMIKIEITERTLVSDSLSTKKLMEEMQALGFIFELDDFGIEYSNMSLFLTLPVNIIKIDRSLVEVINSCSQNRQFFEHLIQGIKKTGRSVIVEGVEDKELLEFLINCGCDYIQGYVFTKPLGATAFEEFITIDKSEIITNI